MTAPIVVSLNHTGTSNSYEFQGFLSGSHTLNAVSPDIIGSDGGEQEVIVIYYTYETRWTLEMLTKDTITTYSDTSIGKMIDFKTDVQNLTTDKKFWTLVWYYWADGINNFSQTLVGRIINASWTVTGESANIKVKCEITFAEDTDPT